MVGRSEGEVGPAAMELGWAIIGANGVVLGRNGRKKEENDEGRRRMMKKGVYEYVLLCECECE